jgi:hypothetical protein
LRRAKIVYPAISIRAIDSIFSSVGIAISNNAHAHILFSSLASEHAITCLNYEITEFLEAIAPKDCLENVMKPYRLVTTDIIKKDDARLVIPNIQICAL